MNLQPMPGIQPPMLLPSKPNTLTSAISMPNINYRLPVVSSNKQIQPNSTTSINNVMNEFNRILLSGTGENGKTNLEPVSTLDHIAKIQCPVVCI